MGQQSVTNTQVRKGSSSVIGSSLLDKPLFVPLPPAAWQSKEVPSLSWILLLF
jgi:hypothetical protein